MNIRIESFGKVWSVGGLKLFLRAWFFLTYPLQLVAWYLLFGWRGVALGSVMLALNFRGKL